MKIAGKRVGNIGYNRAELTRADLTQADLTRGRVDPHSVKRPIFIGLERSRGQSIYCYIHWLALACR